jgi:hypothetical protein
MAKKTEHVVIDGVQYAITQLGAESGRGLYKKFVTAIGPLLREVVSGSVLDDMQKAIGAATADETTPEGAAAAEAGSVKALQILVPLLIRAVETIPEALFEEMCQAFAPECEVTVGKASNGAGVPLPLAAMFDDHFAGEYTAMTTWLAHCVRVNGFLGKALRGLGAAKTKAAATS